MSVTEIESRPKIRCQQSPISREPIEPILAHAAWLLHRWIPAESDALACEAIYTIEQLAAMLEEREEDARATREVLRSALEVLHEQNDEIDRLRTRRGVPLVAVSVIGTSVQEGRLTVIRSNHLPQPA